VTVPSSDAGGLPLDLDQIEARVATDERIALTNKSRGCTRAIVTATATASTPSMTNGTCGPVLLSWLSLQG
jgi:hypothetical protein